MSTNFPVLQDLPAEVRAEIARIQKIPSGQRTSGESAFIAARSKYINTDSSNNITNTSGTTVPAPGTTGYANGAIFKKVDFFGNIESVYENIGDETRCNFAQTGRDSNTLVTVSTDGTGDYNCDGVADEVEINKAIQLVNSFGGGEVYVKPGTYNISSTDILLSSVNNIILRGAGHSTIFKLATDGRILLNKSTNIKLIDFKVDSSSQTGGGFADSQQSITMTSVRNVEVKGLFVDAFAFGFYIVSSDTSTVGGFDTEELWIHHCYIRGRCRNDLIGGGPQSDTSYDFKNILIEDNFIIHDASLLLGGSYYNAMDMVGVKGVKFLNNVVEGSILFGNERDPNYFSSISGNVVRPPRGTTDVMNTIYIQDDSNATDQSSQCSITDNILYGGAIKVVGTSGQKVTQINIDSNIIVNDPALTNGGHLFLTQNAIHLKNATNCKISNNICIGPSVSASGIVLEDSSGCKVNDNYTDGYTRGLTETGTNSNHYYSNNYLVNFSVAGTSSLTGSCFNNIGINPIKQHDQGNITGSTTFTRVNGDVITATLTGNITATVTAGIIKGDRLTLKLTQDGTGSRTLSNGSSVANKITNVKLAGGSLTLSTGANAIDVLHLFWDGSSWIETSRALNQS